MIPTAQDFNKLITTSNYVTRFTINLSIARVSIPLELTIPSLAKVNGMFIMSKGTGEYQIVFRFHLPESIIGLPPAYFSNSEITDGSSFPFEFRDLIITNTAQPNVINPVVWIGYNIDG
ncbi:MAG: hypothetical protein QME49_01625 [bacterium]|nr:hypothetical protein [bacterium]